MANVYDDSRNLPHYTSNKESGIGKEDPVYQNMFIVTFITPDGVSGADLLSKAVTSFSGGLTNPGTGVVEQTFRGATRSFAEGKLEQTTADLTFNFNLNINEGGSMYIYKILRAWSYKKHNPITGTRGKKEDYVGSIIVEWHDRDGFVFKRDFYLDCWLQSGLPSLDGDHSSGDIINLEGIVFRCDSYTEELV